MDYEKMYKAVLKTATQWIKDGCSDKEKICLESIFPELRESEDERIRVRLIEYFKGFLEGFEDCYKDGGNVKWEGLDVKSILAWLEKQKEQKSNIELIQKSWYMEGYHDKEFNCEPKWIIKTGEGGPKYELNPRYGQPLAKEQKEIPLMNGDADLFFDEWNQQHSNSTKRECFEAGVLYAVRLLTEDSPMLEEFKKGLEQVILWGREGYKVSPDGTTKSQTQDEIDEVLDGIGDGIENWLKSLRPSWKPSEEQMEALEYVIRDYREDSCNATANYLQEILDHLKNM